MRVKFESVGVLLILIISVSTCYSQEEFTSHQITDNYKGVWFVEHADLDSDGDMDLITSADDSYSNDRFRWWENTGNSVLVSHVISRNYAARSVIVDDFDGDGDIDLLSSGGDRMDRDVTSWWENNGSEQFTQHSLQDSVHQNLIYLKNIDMDEDGDRDILSTSMRLIIWWENEGDLSFNEHTIPLGFRNAVVEAVDLDGDDDIDIIAGMHPQAREPDSLVWFENDGNQEYTEHTLVNNISYVGSIDACDIEDDNDIDLLFADTGANRIICLENDGNLNFTEQVLITNFRQARIRKCIDIDGDDFIDILASSIYRGLYLFVNNGNGDFDEHIINDNYKSCNYACVADIDGDRNVDIVVTAEDDDTFTWWENLGNFEFVAHNLAGSIIGATSLRNSDIDGDEDIDLVCTSLGSHSVSWLEQVNDQQFIRHYLGYFPHAKSCYAMDMDCDDDIDIVASRGVINQGEGGVSWWENDGTQNFIEHTVGLGHTNSISAADIDGDFDVDIICNRPSAYEARLGWYENNGNMAFALQDFGINPAIPHSYTSPYSAIVMDFDEDEDIDILYVSNTQNDFISWLENDGNMEFTHSTISDSFNHAPYLCASDIDQDDDLDVLSASHSNNEIAIFENNGEEEFILNQSIQLTRAQFVFVADMDGDSDNDIISSYYRDYRQNVCWWENDGELEFSQHELDRNSSPVTTLSSPIDIDDDGDYDLFNSHGSDIYWLENHYSPEPPDLFRLFSPPDGDTLVENTQRLRWQRTTDPNPDDRPHYDVWLDFNRDLSTAWQIGDSLDATEVRLYDLLTSTYYWTVRATDGNTEGTWANETWSFQVEYEDRVEDAKITGLPTEYSVVSTYPNPFNPTTTISVGLPISSELKISVYNITGQKIAALADEHYSVGYHQFTFNADELSSGIYFIHASVPGKMDEIRKVVLLR
ncbi:MAG: FG-GAP-like repeat-containing protein [Candidatus Electryonea clarkiae]|nr:FG-GAP-like repeat-containing protein [Candidatus Electryonea clarkiae]MDP8285325.1 FG-GAP-like repeat-containing protein [Candidatus Electryonea clarkiae]